MNFSFIKKLSKKQKIGASILSILAILFILFLSFFLLRLHALKNPQIKDISTLDAARFKNICTNLYPRQIVKKSTFKTGTENCTIAAEAGIMIDAKSGTILFEKNADEIIPPASMTKLVVMYVVFQEIATGRISLQDIVPLPKESWASSAPPNSSLMFLEQGQIVTLEELLCGLAVCSGNDAAIAVAHYVSGSVENFVKRMNDEMKKLSLYKTHFTEPSGYSEKNVTTPKEFASFSRIYINRYPQSLRDFHSKKEFTYPKEKNLASWHKNDGKDHSITQKNTNKALSLIVGVNGLKTGFIYESGYNLSLTCTRNNTQILTVTMRGPGRGSLEGNKWRVSDARELLETAYSSIRTITPQPSSYYSIAVLGGTESSITAKPAWDTSITIPLQDNQKITKTVSLYPYLKAPIKTGDQVGVIQWKYKDTVLEEIPIATVSSVKKGKIFYRMLDTMSMHFLNSK